MNEIELQSKNYFSKNNSKEKLLYSNNSYLNNSSIFKSRKFIIIASISIVTIISLILIIALSTSSSSESNTEKETPKDSKDSNKNYKKEDFYSTRTKSYYDLINHLDEENAILYHWNLELDENNNAIFKNKYQNLYNYSTDLNAVNESIGYHLYIPENYRTIDTDLANYYKAINTSKPDHLIYGPSINGKEYAKNQSLFSDNIKIGKDHKNGLTISFNIKKE